MVQCCSFLYSQESPAVFHCKRVSKLTHLKRVEVSQDCLIFHFKKRFRAVIKCANLKYCEGLCNVDVVFILVFLSDFDTSWVNTNDESNGKWLNPQL